VPRRYRGRDINDWLNRLGLFDTKVPIQKRGVTAYEGLYFLGMPWLRNRRSGILFGVGDDAAYLARRIAARELVRVPVKVSSGAWW
jgi:hypothetical protein